MYTQAETHKYKFIIYLLTSPLLLYLTLSTYLFYWCCSPPLFVPICSGIVVFLSCISVVFTHNYPLLSPSRSNPCFLIASISILLHIHLTYYSLCLSIFVVTYTFLLLFSQTDSLCIKHFLRLLSR